MANLKEKLEVSDMKCSLVTEECNKMKTQLEELLRVKEVSSSQRIIYLWTVSSKINTIKLLCPSGAACSLTTNDCFKNTVQFKRQNPPKCSTQHFKNYVLEHVISPTYW